MVPQFVDAHHYDFLGQIMGLILPDCENDSFCGRALSLTNRWLCNGGFCFTQYFNHPTLATSIVQDYLAREGNCSFNQGRTIGSGGWGIEAVIWGVIYLALPHLPFKRDNTSFIHDGLLLLPTDFTGFTRS